MCMSFGYPQDRCSWLSLAFAMQTPMFVYEERCPICSGTGVTASPGRQRRLGSCALCGGIGVLTSCIV